MRTLAIIAVVLICLIVLIAQHGINYMFRKLYETDGDDMIFIPIFLTLLSYGILAITIVYAVQSF